MWDIFLPTWPIPACNLEPALLAFTVAGINSFLMIEMIDSPTLRSLRCQEDRIQDCPFLHELENPQIDIMIIKLTLFHLVL